jgi:hypothetical protein
MGYRYTYPAGELSTSDIGGYAPVYHLGFGMSAA